jgi:hypothetical protein
MSQMWIVSTALVRGRWTFAAMSNISLQKSLWQFEARSYVILSSLKRPRTWKTTNTDNKKRHLVEISPTFTTYGLWANWWHRHLHEKLNYVHFSKFSRGWPWKRAWSSQISRSFFSQVDLIKADETRRDCLNCINTVGVFYVYIVF